MPFIALVNDGQTHRQRFRRRRDNGLTALLDNFDGILCHQDQLFAIYRAETIGVCITTITFGTFFHKFSDALNYTLVLSPRSLAPCVWSWFLEALPL